LAASVTQRTFDRLPLHDVDTLPLSAPDETTIVDAKIGGGDAGAKV